MFFPFFTPKNSCLPVFLWLVAMGWGNPRLVFVPGTQRAATEDPGTRPPPTQGQACPKLGPLPGFYRELELTSEMPTSGSKTVAMGNWGLEPLPTQGAGSGGQGEDRSMEIHIPGSRGRTPFPT